MKIFITGVEGYIGKVLAAELIKAGHEVAGLDAGFYNEAWLYGEKSNNYQVIRKDIRQIELEDLQSYDAVVHLAELSNDPLGDLNPEVAVEMVKLPEVLVQAEVPPEANVNAPVELPILVAEVPVALIFPVPVTVIPPVPWINPEPEFIPTPTTAPVEETLNWEEDPTAKS